MPLLLPLLSAAARAECAATTSSADLVSALDQAKAAYGNLDVDGFRAAMAHARTVLPCLSDEVTTHLAAEMHRFEGLHAFVDRMPEKATTAFAAARAVEPNYRFPSTLVPAGNPVLEQYGAIDPDSGRVERVPEPLDGRLTFDGRPSTVRSKSFPTVVQLLDGDGTTRTTAYLWPTDPVPPYTPKPATAQVAEGGGNGGGGSVTDALNSGPDRNFLVGAGVSAGVAAALYAGAFVVHGKYQREDTPIDSLDGLRTANNGLVLASGTGAAVAVGLGTMAFVVGRF